VTNELLSTRKIIQLLQEDINTDVDSTTMNPSVNPHVSTTTNDNWKLVADLSNNPRKPRKLKTLNRALQEQFPISVVPITNRFDTLYNLKINAESPSDTWNYTASKQHKKKNAPLNENKDKRPPIVKRKRILLIGDSHVRGCSSKLGMQLGQAYHVSGTFMPGSRLRNITQLARNEIARFSQEDLVIIWGGANDVNKNESMKGLMNLQEFVELRNNTNFMILTIPHRHDLLDISCVNKEVQKYNAKLHEIMKNKINVRILEISTTREDFTKHGLHLNAAGKNKVTKQISQNIPLPSMEKKKHHIIPGRTTYIYDTSIASDTPLDRNEEHMGDNNEGLTKSQIASISKDMSTLNIDNGILQATEVDQMIINNNTDLNEEHMSDNNKESTNSQIASISKDMSTHKIDDSIPQANEEEQMIIINSTVRSEDLIDLNTQKAVDKEQMVNNIDKGRSEDLIDFRTQEIAEGDQMTIINNMVRSKDQTDPNTPEIAVNEQVIINNNKMKSDDQIHLTTTSGRRSARPKKFPNTRSDDFLWV